MDELLGGGLIPGTLTVVLGATGIGKTQLGLQYAHAGAAAEGRPGVIFDLSSRGDSQSHVKYASRMFGWTPLAADASGPLDLSDFHSPNRRHGEYLRVFGHVGRRVTRRDLDFDAWLEWQAELSRKLNHTIAFFYGNFSQGTRRVVIDGVEPTETPSDSIQFELIEYVYEQILRKDADWLARDLFRQDYRARAAEIAQHHYDQRQVSGLLLCTSAETRLEDLLARPLDEGDVLSNANTIILMGKVPREGRMTRALHVAKHRGSKCSDDIAEFSIDERGLKLV